MRQLINKIKNNKTLMLILKVTGILLCLNFTYRLFFVWYPRYKSMSVITLIRYMFRYSTYLVKFSIILSILISLLTLMISPSWGVALSLVYATLILFYRDIYTIISKMLGRH